jgi:hypothetical protein
MSTANDADCERKSSAAVRRRPSASQGHALEVLGHAIEYLIDSYVATASTTASMADTEATQILMRLSREIFTECPEIIPFRQQMRDTFYGWAWKVKELFLPVPPSIQALCAICLADKPRRPCFTAPPGGTPSPSLSTTALGEHPAVAVETGASTSPTPAPSRSPRPPQPSQTSKTHRPPP